MAQLTHSIVVPAYNESARLGASLEKILAYVQQRGWQAEVLVVNDGSRDNTAEIARAFERRYAAVRLIENPGNRGKGYSVRNGMLHASGEKLLFTDADLSSPIEESEKLFAALEDGADVAMGSRWLQRELQTERQPLHRQLLGRLFNFVLRMILGLKYKDTQCGFKAFTRKSAAVIFPRQQIERWGFDPEILYLARKFHLKIAEVPVGWAHDDRSKINPVVDGMKMATELLRVRWYDISGKYTKATCGLEPAAEPVERLVR
ncbi:MAG TPA: dolichyl-phosphate beta-glucosyltransferase [Terriglobales bacterium]|nr:dolichyl-phosphate beta-glucosyltransferase [Terriglobales bacterium]